MPFIPHTPEEKQQMLDAIGVEQSEQLFDEIPAHLKLDDLSLPAGLSEHAMLRQLQACANKDLYQLSFLGAGAYEHHIPAAVWDLAGRGELMTAYTPYQAEASQGSLQIIYEYQSMLCQLTGMEVSNASVYDGASGLAEAVLMAVRANKKNDSKKVLIMGAVHPHYLDTVRTLTNPQGIVLDHTPHHLDTGNATPPTADDYAGIVLQQPNFFGLLEEVDSITDLAHQQGALMIAVVNPISLALLKPPGQWGQNGADIVVGEGQSLGIPLAGGGPYFGFMCTRKSLVRQLPGRIVGCTSDRAGRRGFTLTLQTREQHIRRNKATSNICTNQGLVVTAATIYLSLLGTEGLKQTALACHKNTRYLLDRLTAIPGITSKFQSPFFHECVLEFAKPPQKMIASLAEQGIIAGLPLGRYYPDLDHNLLLCATETKTTEDIEQLAHAIEQNF